MSEKKNDVEPLLPPEIDLRGYPKMPLDFRRLFASDTWVLGTAEEKVASLHLWCEAWHQQPAGSLPNEDRILAHLSASGMRWKRIKVHALRGWIACRDGRLYHPVVAEMAFEAWESKRDKSRKGKLGAAARWSAPGNAQGLFPDSPGNAPGIPPGNAQAMQREEKGMEVKGNTAKASPTPPSGPFELPDWIDPEAWQGFVEMRKVNKHPLTERAMKLTLLDLEELREKGQDPNACLNQSTKRNWRGVFEVKNGGPGGGRQAAVEHRNADVVDRFARGGRS